MRLFEFAPTSGGDSGGPYAYYLSAMNFAKVYAEQWGDTEKSDIEDAEQLTDTATAFLQGMSAGVEAFNNMDTWLRDELAEHWLSDNLNVEQDIYNHNSNQPTNDQYKTLITTGIQDKIELYKSLTSQIQGSVDKGEDDNSVLSNNLRLINILEQVLARFNQSTKVGLQTLMYLHNNLRKNSYEDAYAIILDVLEDKNIASLFPKAYKK